MDIPEAIEFECPHCRSFIKTSVYLIGSKERCQRCGKDVLVPGKDTITVEKKEET